LRPVSFKGNLPQLPKEKRFIKPGFKQQVLEGSSKNPRGLLKTAGGPARPAGTQNSRAPLLPHQLWMESLELTLASKCLVHADAASASGCSTGAGGLFHAVILDLEATTQMICLVESKWLRNTEGK